ncbi:MAG: precorrin-3B synthase [Methylocystis sp.]
MTHIAELCAGASGAPLIKGWCPGALQPMQSGDGLLMRPKILGSRLTLAQAEEIAGVSRDCGNGRIDVSQRAQMQLRGLSDKCYAPALMRLACAGLTAPDMGMEAALNILSSPLPGEADALVKSLAQAFARDTTLRSLPSKFLFLADDAGPGLADVVADIRLEIGEGEVRLVAEGARNVAVRLAVGEAAEAAMALARAFIRLRSEAPFARRRMRALIAELGADVVFREAGLEADQHRNPRPPAKSVTLIGAGAIGDLWLAGLGVPYARLDATQLSRLVVVAEDCGATELRISPWRMILVPLPSQADAEQMVRAAGELGFIVDAEDPRLALLACSGAPECPQALGATRERLDELAPLAARLAHDGVGLHVSGCAKSCARPAASPATLVARGEGFFDLVFDGGAGAQPSVRGLGLDAAMRLLAERAEGLGR